MPPRLRTVPRKAPRQERAKATVDAILRAAAHILRADGYDGLSTNRVAKKAGVSIGSLYQYFPSKESLVLALEDEHSAEMQQFLLRTVESMQGAPIERVVETFIVGMLNVHEVDPKLHRVLSEQVPRIGGFEKLKELAMPGMNLVRAWLEANKGQLRKMDLDVATYILVTSVESITHLSVLEECALDRKALAKELSELVLRYLGVVPQTQLAGPRAR
jgi:AcrR family transcriptional regulator